MSAASRAPSRSNRARRRAVLTTAGAAVATLLMSACSSGGTSGGGGDTNFVDGQGRHLHRQEGGARRRRPDLSGKTVDGKQLDVASYKGKVVVLNVWGSWCPPCRAEAPGFEKVSQDLQAKGVQFVGINTRDTSTAGARAFEKQYGIALPQPVRPDGQADAPFQEGHPQPAGDPLHSRPRPARARSPRVRWPRSARTSCAG